MHKYINSGKKIKDKKTYQFRCTYYRVEKNGVNTSTQYIKKNNRYYSLNTKIHSGGQNTQDALDSFLEAEKRNAINAKQEKQREYEKKIQRSIPGRLLNNADD